MKGRLLVAVLVPALMLSVFCAVSGSGAAEVIKLKYSNFYPPAHKNNILSEQWCREVEKRTDGRVKISYFPGGTLTPPAQTYDSVVKGITDIGQGVITYTPGRLPLMETINSPLGYSSGYQASKMANALYNKFKPKELDDVKVLYLHAHGPGLFSTKKAIATVDDVKNLRIKCDAMTAKIVSGFAGAPVTMPIPETYDALQKGLVDGILLPMEALKGWRYGEIVKYSVENRGMAYSSGQYVVMNKKKWESLPKDIQQIIEKINEEWIEKQGKQWDELDREGKEFALSKGNKVIKATREEEEKAAQKMRPALENQAKELKARGLPGDEVIEFCLNYLKASQ